MYEFSKQHVMFLLLGLPTWVIVDGVWASLSTIAETAPEGYAISSYLMLCLSISNIFPLLCGYYLSNRVSSRVLKNVIALILGIAFIVGILISFEWYQTVIISSNSVSFPLYLLFFLSSACASSSNVTLYMFVSNYPSSCTTMLSTGMGIGSMLAGIFSLLRGLLLANYDLGIENYFLLLSSLFLLSMIAFRVLSAELQLHTPSALRRYMEVNMNIQNSNRNSNDESSNGEVLEDTGSLLTKQEYNENDFLQSHFHILILLFIIALFGYGVVPSLISYACSKFYRPDRILFLATSISSILDPVFRALTEFKRIETYFGFIISTVVLISLAFLLLICAVANPASSIYAYHNNNLLPLIFYISFDSLFGFTLTSIFLYFKVKIPPEFVENAYRFNSVVMQLGAFVGSLLTFCLIVFKAI